jgi:acyl-CoA thioester hydrolase
MPPSVSLWHEQAPCRAGNLPSMEAFPFTYRQRVRYGETDMQQVVYYANYLLYAEVGRVAYLRHLGLDYSKEFLANGVDFTIGEAHVQYRAPLRFDDEFDIKVRVGEIRHSSWTFEYAIDRADGTHCADLSTVQVVVGRVPPMKAQRLPQSLKATLERARGVAGTQSLR